jgi:hypothetical protein
MRVPLFVLFQVWSGRLNLLVFAIRVS